jgi:hypothetical protein
VPLTIVRPKEASPGPQIHPLADRCRARGAARRVFVDIGHAAAAGCANFEPSHTADARRTYAAREAAQTHREHVFLAEAAQAHHLPQHLHR